MGKYLVWGWERKDFFKFVELLCSHFCSHFCPFPAPKYIFLIAVAIALFSKEGKRL